MAIFQGENLSFKIVLKDDTGATILASAIGYIKAKLYNESTLKVYVEYEQGAGDTGKFDRPIEAAGDDSGFEFALYSQDSLLMPAGRYIIQVEYGVVDASFSNDGGYKVYIQKGALVSISKSIADV